MDSEEKTAFAKMVAEQVANTIACPHDVTETEAVQMKSFLEDRKAIRGYVYRTVVAIAVGAVCTLVAWGLVAYIQGFHGSG